MTMRDADLESRLAELPLPRPCAALRARVIARARRGAAWRRRERLARWALALTALVLIVTNVYYGHIEQRQMLALLGPPLPQAPVDVQQFVQQIEWRNRLIVLLTQVSDGCPKEDPL